MRRLVCLLALSLLGGCGETTADAPANAEADLASGAARIQWSGREWLVKYGAGRAPGPNRWSTDNVSVDADGALHLRIARDASGQWSCAEIWSVEPLGWGTYRFDVVGDIDQLPPEAVLGLYNYRRPEGAGQPTSEIDIEIAQWADPAANRGSFTLWGDTTVGGPLSTFSFPLRLFGTYTSHAFDWRSDSVRFESRHGRGPSGAPIATREERPAAGTGSDTRPVHLNFWLFQGKPPPRPLEVVIRRFSYAP